MGKGIDLAREMNPEHAGILDDLKDQLLIVLIKKFGGELTIPVSEIDDTANDTLSFNVTSSREFGEQVFNFTVGKKH